MSAIQKRSEHRKYWIQSVLLFPTVVNSFSNAVAQWCYHESDSHVNLKCEFKLTTDKSWKKIGTGFTCLDIFHVVM